MRYFLLIFAVTALAVVGIAGKRGSLSRRTPLYIFPDMNRQLKLRPEEPNGFFANGVSSQLPPAGTLARGQPIQTAAGAVYPYQDAAVYTGRVPGTTNFVATNPLTVNAELLARGRQRFTIYCSPCHGAEADGNGITRRIGAMAVVANLHDKRIVEMADGEIFDIITHGKNLMGAYGPNVPVADRWAIIAYLRALQLSWLGNTNDVPPELLGSLRK
jgi:mono/diheme cytochrome c family protein